MLFLDALLTSVWLLFQWNVTYQDPGCCYYYRDFTDGAYEGYW